MLAGVLDLEMQVAIHTVPREQIEQWEFEQALDWRGTVHNGLKLARRYRKFYRTNCNLHALYEVTCAAAREFRRETVLYWGLNTTKSQILFRWLRNTADEHDLEVTWRQNGLISVRW